MKMRVSIILTFMVLVSVVQADTNQTVLPHSMTGLRSFGGSAFMLDFCAIKSIDRTVMHFDVRGLGAVRNATLNVPVWDQDAGVMPAGSIDFYAFAGDGTVSSDEWDAGTFFARVSGISAANQVLTLDVTSLLQGDAAHGQSYMSFVLRPGPPPAGWTFGPNFWLGDGFAPSPSLSVTLPEPGTVVLLGLGAALLRRRRVNIQ